VNKASLLGRAGLAALVLAGGCSTITRYDAAGDIHDFLIAVRDGDQRMFEEHVDRPALKANLRARLLARAAAGHGVASGQAAAALLAGPLVDVAVDALVQPQTFRAAASLAGYGPQTHVPGALAIGQDVQPLDQDRACALIRHRCAFVFKREDGVWRMIDFEGDLGLLGRRRSGAS
jgi:hypothetical protein